LVRTKVFASHREFSRARPKVFGWHHDFSRVRAKAFASAQVFSDVHPKEFLLFLKNLDALATVQEEVSNMPPNDPPRWGHVKWNQFRWASRSHVLTKNTERTGKMIDLKRYFEVPFEDPAISLDEFLLFGTDHLARLKEQDTNGPDAGSFTALVTATEPLLTAFNAAMSERDSATSSREGGTMSKDQALESFQLHVRRREGTIKGEFGKPSPQYEEFFPRGLSEYARATMANAEVLMDRMVTKTTKYQAQLGAPMVAEFTDLRTAFVNARTTQLGQIGGVSDARDQLKNSRAALELQMTVNLMTVAIKYLKQPEKVSLFFNQTLLEDPNRSQTPEPPPAPPPSPAPQP
jgi:hypothetical protein